MILDSTFVEMVGAAGALLTTICWLPQAVHVIRSRDTRAISLSAYCTFAAGIALWLAYGLSLGKWPIIASNLVTLPLVLAIIGLKLKFG